MVVCEGEGDAGGEGSNWGSAVVIWEDILGPVSPSDGRGRIGTEQTENTGRQGYLVKVVPARDPGVG